MTTFEPATLPLAAKEDLCRALLAEFGVTGVRTRAADHELNHRCPLPWHSEKHPSASLNYEKLCFRCLGCNSRGGLLWFVAMCRGVPGPQARDWLLQTSGLGSDFDLAAVLRVIDAAAAGPVSRRQPIPWMSPRVLDPWRWIHPYLTDPTTATPPGRGVPVQNVRDLQVGYAERYPLGRDAAGVERFAERVVIPHFWDGHLVGWQSRRLADDGTPRWLSTVDFPRDRTLYRHDPTRPAAVVVESPMSVLRHAHHLPLVATFGAAVTDEQVRLLAEHRRVVLWMDNDTAGWRATDGYRQDGGPGGRRDGQRVPGLVERLTPYCDVAVVDSPWAADAADLDDDTARALVAAAVPGAVWSPPAALRCWLCKGQHGGRCP